MMDKKKEGKVFAYARTSTQDQNLDRQIDKLLEYGIHKSDIYMEKITGTKRDRPKLNQLLKDVEEGDKVVITELSRLGRSTRDLINISEQLKEKGVELHSLKESIDTTTPQGNAMFGMFSVMAQFERDIISERTHEGLKSARARGRIGGRPKTSNKDIERALKLYDADDMSVNDICELIGISKPTLYKYINKRKVEQQQQQTKEEL